MHNLFNDRFYSLREPAWHSLGYVSKEPLGAQDAISKIGAYDLHLENITTETGKAIPYKALYRDPTPDDPVERFMNTVGPEYVLITPQNVCELWDEWVHAPIETMGMLGKGEQLFLTTKLKDVTVKGDIIENYLLGYFPYTGFEAINLAATPVRTVCQNTLGAARRMASETIKVVHDSTALERLKSNLNGVVQRAEERAQNLAIAYSKFAEHKITSEEKLFVYDKVYPIPAPYKDNKLLSPSANADKRYRTEADIKWYGEARTLCDELFNGHLTGATEATYNTAWGLFNSIVEHEDYRSARTEQSRANRALFGWSAGAKEKAFDTLLTICK